MKGIPKEILDELDINKIEEEQSEFQATAIVEAHQIKLPVPKGIRSQLDFKKGQKVKVIYDSKNKTITYKY